MTQNRRRSDHERILLTEIRKHGAMTKYDLAEKMNISIPTVTANVNKLLEDGILKTAGVAESGYGRKPILIDIDYNQYFSIGIDIQKHCLHYCLMNLKFELTAENTMRSTGILENDIKEVVDRLLSTYPIKKENIIGIGVSYPGLVEEEKLLLKKSPGTDSVNLSFKPLKEALDIEIYIGNEARLAAFAENIIGVSQDYMNSLYISIKEGIGAGIIVDKRYYAGSSEAAGEIGHMVIHKGGKLCNCGNRGCAEAYLSSHVLIDIFSELLDIELRSLKEVFINFNPDSKIHKQVMKEYVNYLVLMLNNVFLIFDPECVIIGGEMSEYKKQIEPIIKEIMESNICSMLQKDRKIAFSILGHKASKCGAALRPLEEIMALT